jgi:restriction system protein
MPDVPILLQAFVEPIGNNEDGSIVELLGPAWKAVLDALEKDPEALLRLSPRQMEELVAASYDAAGFDEVVLTPRSGDFGRDVVATKHDRFRIRIIDQVKAYAPGHRVTANDVRALSGVLHGDPRATKGIVTTTSTFAPGIATDPFIAPLIPYRLELFDGQALTQRLLSLRR